MANVQRGYLDLAEVKEIEATEREIEALRLQPGDILLNEGGDRDKLGRGWIWQGELPECVHQNHVFRARLRDPDDEPKFVSYYANSVGARYFLDQGKQTTNLASINLTKLGALPICLPDGDEQRRIVAEVETQFSRLDASVAALKRAQLNLKRYRASVLKAASEGRLVPTEAEMARREGRSYESGSELLARVREERRRSWSGRGRYVEPAGPDTERLPELPEGWAWSSFDQLHVFLRNGISAKPDAENGLPILRISAVRPLQVNLGDTRYLSGDPSAYEGFVLTEGDLLFTRYNGNPDLVGVCGRVPAMPFACVHPDKLIRCKLAEPVDSGFVALTVNVGHSRDYLAKRVRTTAGQAGISGGDLKQIPVPLPPLAEQVRIVAEVERRLSAAGAAEKTVQAGLVRAARLRQAVLARAFSGGDEAGC